MKALTIIAGTLIGFASLGASRASADTIVGDSISQMTFAGTDRGTAYMVNSAAGRGAFNWGFGDIGSGAEVLAFAAPNVEAGEWLVVELGTNDLYYNTDLLQFADFVAQVEAATPDDVCLGWVIPTYPDRPQDGRMEALIRGKVRQHHATVLWTGKTLTRPKCSLRMGSTRMRWAETSWLRRSPRWFPRIPTKPLTSVAATDTLNI